MSIAVIGCGRSGTNMVLEILSGNSGLKPSEMVENKKLFKSGEVYPDDYLTKCDTVYFNVAQFDETMQRNLNMKIVWTIRDPRDMILSKIKRGQTRANGGDNKILADDGTPEGCLKDIRMMMIRYHNAINKYSDRVYLVKMEDFILDLEGATKNLCDVLGLTFEPQMLDFMSRMRNADKAKRYKGLDKGEYQKWKGWETCYDGFFSKTDFGIPKLFEEVIPLVEEFGYN